MPAWSSAEGYPEPILFWEHLIESLNALGLIERERARYLEAAGAHDERRRHLAHVRGELVGIDVDGDRVEVGQEDQAILGAFDLAAGSEGRGVRERGG